MNYYNLLVSPMSDKTLVFRIITVFRPTAADRQMEAFRRDNEMNYLQNIHSARSSLVGILYKHYSTSSLLYCGLFDSVEWMLLAHSKTRSSSRLWTITNLPKPRHKVPPPSNRKAMDSDQVAGLNKVELPKDTIQNTVAIHCRWKTYFGLYQSTMTHKSQCTDI